MPRQYFFVLNLLPKHVKYSLNSQKFPPFKNTEEKLCNDDVKLCIFGYYRTINKTVSHFLLHSLIRLFIHSFIHSFSQSVSQSVSEVGRQAGR